MSPSNHGFRADVFPDGTVVPREHYKEIGKGTIDPSGEVECTVTIEAWTLTFTGRLTREGTGGGTIREEEEARTTSSPPDLGTFWTAEQTLSIPHAEPPAPEPVRAGPGAPQRIPRWAVGQWEMTGPGEDTGMLTVKSDGSVRWTLGMNKPAPRGEPRVRFGPGTVDSSGQVEIKARLGGEEMTLTGKLNPDRTATGGTSPHGVAWTATKMHSVDLLLDELVGDSGLGTSLPGIPAQSAPTLRVLDSGRHPTGVAVLLEVRAPE